MPRMNVNAPACALLLALAAPALAQTGNPQQSVVAAPEPPGSTTYGGEIDSKIQLDGNFNRGQKGFAELYAKSVITAYVNLGDAFSIRGEATYERFKTQTASTAFNTQGLYLSQLYGAYAIGPVTVYAGKIHPRFTVGFDQVPGIYDTFANDYEQKERIGFGAAINLAPAWGKHILSAETYFLDTTILSRSLLAYPDPANPNVLRPGRFRKDQGGAGNTQNLQNFDIALDGSRIPGVESLRYHLGLSRQAASQPSERPETGVAASLSYEFKLTPRIAMTPFVELAHFNNYAGTPGETRDYIVSAVEFDYRKYALSLVAAPRRVAQDNAGTRWDMQYSATLAYTIMPRLTVAAGYIYTQGRRAGDQRRRRRHELHPPLLTCPASTQPTRSRSQPSGSSGSQPPRSASQSTGFRPGTIPIRFLHLAATATFFGAILLLDLRILTPRRPRHRPGNPRPPHPPRRPPRLRAPHRHGRLAVPLRSHPDRKPHLVPPQAPPRCRRVGQRRRLQPAPKPENRRRLLHPPLDRNHRLRHREPDRTPHHPRPVHHPPPCAEPPVMLRKPPHQPGKPTMTETPTPKPDYGTPRPKVPPFARYVGTSAWRKDRKRVREYARFLAAKKHEA